MGSVYVMMNSGNSNMASLHVSFIFHMYKNNRKKNTENGENARKKPSRAVTAVDEICILLRVNDASVFRKNAKDFMSPMFLNIAMVFLTIHRVEGRIQLA